MTISPQILEISVGSEPIEEWLPENTRSFYVQVEIVISVEVDDGTIFYLEVATPDLFENMKNQRFIHKILFVEEYKAKEIEQFIKNVVCQTAFDSTDDLFNHIRKYFGWEFDDYSVGKY